jgi:hypothetical protein
VRRLHFFPDPCKLTEACLVAATVDARATDLDRSAAKAFLLNLNVSLGYRSNMFERLHQPRRAQGEAGRKGQTLLPFAPVAA